MESRSSPLALYSYGGLLLLTALTGAAALLLFESVRAEEARLRSQFQQRSQNLHQIRHAILVSGILARDSFLTPPGPETDALLAQLRQTSRETDLASRHAASPTLRGEINTWWKVLDLMAEMANKPRTPALERYFQQQLAQRRQTMLDIAAGIQSALDSQRLQAEQDINGTYTRFRLLLGLSLIATLTLGLIVAAATSRRLIQLESNARRLSAQLVRAQEEERRAVARELHDEIGQSLSSLLLEAGTGNPISQRLEQAVESVRRIALSLRPSMLDDLGLVPALEWLARETWRLHQIPVQVHAADSAGDAPESHRTCIFRVAQEALRNAACHGAPSRITVQLEKSSHALRLQISDNGKGFNAARTRGLGLLGIEERIAQLDGRMHLHSTLGKGTTLTAELPL